jgi:hypothetical protein
MIFSHLHLWQAPVGLINVQGGFPLVSRSFFPLFFILNFQLQFESLAQRLNDRPHQQLAAERGALQCYLILSC